MTFLQKPNVVAFVSEDKQQLSLHLSKETVAEFQLELNRALNCHDAAPRWLFALADMLSCTPAPYDARQGSLSL